MTSAHTKLRLLCGLLCAVAVCSAQDTPPRDAHNIGNGVSPIGNGVSTPRLRYKVQSEYSAEARKSRLEGTVVLRIVVGTDGKPRDLKVLHSLGMGLDENAIAAVSKWLFQPGEKDGQPVDVFAQIKVNFRLGDHASRWHMVRAEFHLPPGAERPVIEKGPTPHVADDAVGATATLTFDVNEKGEPVNIQVENTSDNSWASEVSAALSKWKFIPASKDGVPISVSCTMEFVRGSI
jgi:TonB family protein